MTLKDRLKANLEKAGQHATKLTEETKAAQALSETTPVKRNFGHRPPDLRMPVKAGTIGGITPEKILPDREKGNFIKQTLYIMPIVDEIVDNIAQGKGRRGMVYNVIALLGAKALAEYYEKTGNYISLPQLLFEMTSYFSNKGVITPDYPIQMLAAGWEIDGITTKEEFNEMKRMVDLEAFNEIINQATSGIPHD